MAVQGNTLLTKLLEELSEQSGKDFLPGEDGVLTVLLDGVTVSVESREGSDFAYFSAPVQKLSRDPLAQLRHAMQLNLFSLPMSGAWLALEEDSQEFLLCHTARLDGLNTAKILAIFDAMAGIVADLRRAVWGQTADACSAPTEAHHVLRI